MTGVTNPVRPVFKDILDIRAVGGVACAAIALCERNMPILCFLFARGFVMTGKTESRACHVEQVLVFRRMGSVTGKTTFAHHDRLMVKCNLLCFGRMTLEAELVALIKEEFPVL